MSAIFGHPPLCKLQRNNSRSIDHLSEEGPLAFFSIRDEPFITQICRRSQESCSNLVGHRTVLVESGPTHTIDANSPRGANGITTQYQAERRLLSHGEISGPNSPHSRDGVRMSNPTSKMIVVFTQD
jgi:hypothetical protein